MKFLFKPFGEDELIFRKTDGLFLLGLLGALSLLNYRVFFMGHAFALIDCSLFFLPLWKWGSISIAKGILPLWNPDAAFGTPYLADPETACFYPPVPFAFQVFSPSTALNILVLGHYAWALLGFWTWGRSRGLDRWALFWGCLVFGFSVNATSLPLATTMILTFSWVPWVFWSAERVWSGEKNSFLLFSSIVAMQMVSGYPLYCYLTLFAWGVEKTVRVLMDRKTKGFSLGSWGRVIGAMGLGAIYNLVWLIPFWEFRGFGNTQERLGYTLDVSWPYLATWLNPFFMGHPLHSYHGLHPAVGNYFFGLPALVFLLFFILRKKGRSVVLWVFFLLMALSLGKTAWVGEWFREVLPGFGWVVRSGYIIFIIGFYVARLTADSVTLASKDWNEKTTTLWLFALAVAVYASALGLGVPMGLTSFWLSLALLLLPLAGFFPEKWRWGAVTLALVFSLGPVVRTLNFTVPRSFYEQKPEFVDRLDKPGRIFHTHRTINYYWALPGESVGDVYQKMKRGLISNWPLTLGLEETYFNNTFYLRTYADWEFPAMQFSPVFTRKAVDYLNIRYVFGENEFKGFRPLGLATAVPVFENPDPMPKWNSLQTAISQADWERDLRRAEGPAFDFRKDCFVEDGGMAGRYMVRGVQELSRGVDRIELGVSGGGKALLVSSETAYPGWKAVVDGKERALVEVNHGFRGLLVEDGETKVELSFEPNSFRFGLFFLLLACGCWAGMILRLTRKHKYA